MDAAVVVTWTRPIAGREAKALEYGAEADRFWGEQVKQGRCSPPEMFFSEHGLNMWIVKGDRDTLQQIHDTEENRMLIFQGGLLLENYSVDVCYTGDSADDFLTRYAKALQTVG